MEWRQSKRAVPLAGLLLLLMACGGRPQSQVNAGMDVAPPLVVERFLRAANSNDLTTMGQLFGTRDGSVLNRDARGDVEQRMFVLASILRHDDYAVRGEQIVPGRTQEAVRLMVLMTVKGDEIMVPFTLVRARAGGWLVEKIDVEAITRR